jgi:ribonuclease BN (tRNA processing enzyme)
MSWQLDILGSGGWIPTETRQTCSVLFRSGKKAILIDAGTGVTRLLDKKLLQGIEELSLVLTHFHLDHVAGLGCLEGLLPQPIPVYAPAQMLYGTKSDDVIKTFISPPYLSAPFSNTFTEVSELEASNEISGFRVDVRKQEKHSLATAALRIEDSITYLTDTSFDLENVEFAQGSEVMFHEAWYVDGASDTHSSGKEAGEIALQAQVDRLYLIHINPFIDAGLVVADAQKVFPKTELARDKQIIVSKR